MASTCDHDDPGAYYEGMGFGETVQASLKQARRVFLDQIVEPHSVYPVHYVVTAATPEGDTCIRDYGAGFLTPGG